MQLDIAKSSPTLLLAALFATACSQSSTPTEQLGGEPGTQVLGPDGTVHVVMPNAGGNAENLVVERVLWGRLVDLYDRHPATGARTLRHADLLVGAASPDGSDWELATHALTGREELTVNHAFGSTFYDAVVAELEAGLAETQPKSADPSVLPPWSAVPRNAALVVEFNDLLDPATVDSATVQLRTGYPPVTPFEARIFPDPNHGALVETPAGPVFHSTRVVVDPALVVGDVALASDALQVNPVGLPAAVVLNQPNLELRLPSITSAAAGQFTRLSNLSGNGLAPLVTALQDASSPTLDIVRAARSGGPATLTFDLNNGFLPDNTAPRLLGTLSISVTLAVPVGPVTGGIGQEWAVDLAFADLACAVAPEIGDVVRIGDTALTVTLPSAPPVNGVVLGVRGVLVPGFDAQAPSAGAGVLRRTFRDGDTPACFVLFSSLAGGAPGSTVRPDSDVALLFSEPLDPASLRPFEGMTLTRVASAPGPTEIVVGQVLAQPDLSLFTFRPSLPLAHELGLVESYWLQSPTTPTDLAGNPLANPLPTVEFTLDPGSATERTGGTVLRFHSLDEDANGAPEVRGQFLYDGANGVLRPRAVQHFSQVADRQQPLQGLMQEIPHPTFASPFDAGIRDPLNPLGSRVMTTWRYADLDLPVGDEATHNVDVEGMHWSPRSGSVTADSFANFEMRLAHSTRQPDEAADLATATVFAPGSGLTTGTFAENVLSDPASPLTVVHAGAQGYTLDPSDAFLSSTGSTMFPFPMNRDLPVSDHSYFTWRDTAVQAVGGDDGLGVDLGAWFTEGSLPTIDDAGFWAAPGSVPSVGLPLLIDLACSPDTSAIGVNQFDFLLSGFPTTFGFDLPANTRIFSSGGSDASGNEIEKDPALQTIPTGGYNLQPTFGAVGSPTSPADSIFYLGQLDLVTRKSRVHSIWFDTGGLTPQYADVVLAGNQPSGTLIDVDYRGALSVVGGALDDAGLLDAYGDERAPGTVDGQYTPPATKNPGVSLSSGATWSAEPSGVDGSRYFQLRLTFLGNAATGVTADLDAIGVAYQLD